MLPVALVVLATAVVAISSAPSAAYQVRLKVEDDLMRSTAHDGANNDHEAKLYVYYYSNAAAGAVLVGATEKKNEVPPGAHPFVGRTFTAYTNLLYCQDSTESVRWRLEDDDGSSGIDQLNYGTIRVSCPNLRPQVSTFDNMDYKLWLSHYVATGVPGNPYLGTGLPYVGGRVLPTTVSSSESFPCGLSVEVPQAFTLGTDDSLVLYEEVPAGFGASTPIPPAGWSGEVLTLPPSDAAGGSSTVWLRFSAPKSISIGTGTYSFQYTCIAPSDTSQSHRWFGGRLQLTWGGGSWVTSALLPPDQVSIGAIVSDCDGDGIDDFVELARDAQDCNQNLVPDPCDISNGTSSDTSPTYGVPDECEGIAPPLSSPTSTQQGGRDVVGLAVYPNPALGAARLRLSVAAPGRFRVTVHDVAGRLVSTVAERAFGAGDHWLDWAATDDDARVVGSGVYFVRVTGTSGDAVSRVIRIR
jgi:hypothetical protein